MQAKRRVWPWVALAVAVAASIIGMVDAARDADSPLVAFNEMAYAGLPMLFTALGVLIETRRPGNRIGWLLMGIGGGLVFDAIISLARDSIHTPPQRLTPGMFLLLWANDFSWITFLFPTFLLLYVFPTGSLLSRRWRWVFWLMSVMTVFLLGTFVVRSEVGPVDGSWTVDNPIGFVSPDSLDVILTPWSVALILLAVGGVSSILLRYRRSSNTDRAQIKLVLASVAFFAVSYGILVLAEGWTDASSPVALLLPIGFGVIPVAITIAVLRHGLFDIDVVVSRTVSYTILAAFITGVYALIVVGIGNLVGGESSVLLSVVAVGVVAVVFEPVRVRVQRWANRLVYGERATPYEVLAETTRRLADTTSTEDTLARIVDLVVAGTGAAEAVLWMKIGDRLRVQSADTPEALQAHVDVSVTGHADPVIPGDASVLVKHRGELLGAVSITKPRGQTATKGDEKVLSDVAAGAGLLLRNIGLNTALVERADELRASRRRLVATHDAERHRLERDLHDGAQQQVVALKVKLGIARTLAGREGADRVSQIVESLAEDTQIAVDEMRAVAHGIYPPLLDSEGLVAALKALARKTAVPVVVHVDGLGRYDRTIEQTVYFCVLEAVNRALDSGATAVTATVSETPETIGFTIEHGTAATGDLTSIQDRIDAFGGFMNVTSDNTGTTITAQLPAFGQATLTETASL